MTSMAAFDLSRLTGIGEDEIARFRRDGFLVVERILSPERIEALRERFPLLFAGRFDTGIYPDEWYWREGMSLPDVTRHMANAWKADLTVARLALSADIGGAAALLAGWSGTRLGQDTIWWKAPRTKPVSHHQDTSFLDVLDPQATVTCWVTLDDTHRDAGTLEYVPGSHLWPLTPIPEGFHAPDDYRAHMRAAAAAAGITPPEPVLIEVPAGSCVFHAGEIWHGSGANVTDDRMRRAIGVHLVPEQARFSDRPGGYIYRRYQRTGDPTMDESYFPILWSRAGHRTAWIEGYCETGRRQPQSKSTLAA
jgi:phytanoyl-CoA hydroxylase